MIQKYGTFVNKSPHPFSAIGADHGIQQLNRELKVVSGVKGLLMNKNALRRFTLIAPVLDSICQSFSQINNLAKETRSKHYQLSGSTNCRIISNADKLHSYFQSLDVSYANSDNVYNIVSNAVLPESIAPDVLDQENIGKNMYQDFLSERIYGEKSIWDTMKKRKLLTFKSSGTTIKTKIEGKVVELKEDKALLQRILIISQKRPEINVPKLIGEFEFSYHTTFFI